MPRQPNVLLILADQHRYDCVGAHGAAVVQTPSLDRLAREGARFDRAYTPCGLCSPTRASLLTGLYPHNHHLIVNTGEAEPVLGWDCLDSPQRTLAGRLRDAGYQTGYTGKWHLGSHGPKEHGFDLAPYREKMDPDPYEQYVADRVGPEDAWPCEEIMRRRLPNGHEFLFTVRDNRPVEWSRPHFIAKTAIDMLEQFAARPDRPFFLDVNFFGPHLPFRVHPPFADMYDPSDVPEWPAFGDSLEGKPFQQRRQRAYWNTEGLPWAYWQPVVARYFGFISMIDAQIGRLLTRLDDLGLTRDTLVVYAADHGDSAGDRGMFDKGYIMSEEHYHVPLIARWPQQIEPGGVRDEFVSLLDLPVSFLDVGGAEPFERADGRSLAPLLRGGTPDDWPDQVVSEFHGMQWSFCTQRMIRDARWKLVFNGTDTDELYDLERDPWELSNLASDPRHEGKRAEMRQRLFNAMWASGDYFATWLSRRG